MFQKNFTPKKYWNKYEVFDKVVTFLTLAQLTEKKLVRESPNIFLSLLTN